MFQCLLSLHHLRRSSLWCAVRRGRLTGLLAFMPAAYSLLLTVDIDTLLRVSHCWLSTLLLVNGDLLTRRTRARSSRAVVFFGLPDLGLSFTSLVCPCFAIKRLITVWLMFSCLPISLHDIPVVCMPMICHFTRSLNLRLAIAVHNQELILSVQINHGHEHKIPNLVA